jgi:hypothetical protein
MATIHQGLVDRAKNIILTPKTEWPVIDTEPTTIGDIYKNYVLPLAAIPAIAHLIGSLLFGYGTVLGITVRPSPVTAIGSAITQYVMSLITVFVLALIVDGLAPTFGGVSNRVQAFKIAAYSNTAGWLAGVLTILPTLGPIAALVGLYGLYLLYLGLPVLMRSATEKTMAYTIVTIVAAIVLFIVAAAIVGAVGSLFSPASISITAAAPVSAAAAWV